MVQQVLLQIISCTCVTRLTKNLNTRDKGGFKTEVHEAIYLKESNNNNNTYVVQRSNFNLGHEAYRSNNYPSTSI